MSDLFNTTNSETKTLPEMIQALKKENAANEGKPQTYGLEYRVLLQWLFEKHMEAEGMPEAYGGGYDGGGEREAFEREYQIEYRKRLTELRLKYGITE